MTETPEQIAESLVSEYLSPHYGNGGIKTAIRKAIQAERDRRAELVEAECKHEWLDIFRHDLAISTEVVRWCRFCGAYVICEDYDGRVNWGGVCHPRKAGVKL